MMPPWSPVQTQIPSKPAGTKLKTEHDQWFNMNEIVVKNILQTPLWRMDLFKNCWNLALWKEAVLERVKDLGAVSPEKTPSIAWCYLYKLCLLEPSVEDVEEMTNKDQSTPLRGLVFLYIRMVAAPKRLWYWFSRYLHEKTPIKQNQGEMTTLGEFLLSLLKNNKYAGTCMDFPLPRIHVPVHRAYRKKIYIMELIEKDNKPFKNAFQPGVKVLGLYHDDQEWYSSVIKEILDNGNYIIDFEE